MSDLPPQPLSIPQPESPAPQNSDEQTLGMLAHLLGLLTGFVGPLIIWLVKRETSPYLDHHGKESLNFQITLALVTICFGALAFVVAFVTMGLGMIVLAPLWMVMMIVALVWEIQACIAASNGQLYRYPFAIRLIA